eukprot:CAMPEP_0119029898 /NCGR_PEP_ID=MMETSP1176-20130426/40753_1 /TAXON_ID=265551 /ORGANISM="Synedropsis recta cf, Strain CCMP1620" /LENGTH=2040 /DNA_ID=CAMNT_0006986259 /DNA_START=40 /DNA_END=6162 /DNA_ORIENTATION=+
MRLLYSLFLATLPAAGVAFMATPRFAGMRHTTSTSTQVYGYLDDIKDVKVEKQDTVAIFDDYVKKVEAAFGRAQTRMDTMQTQMKTKEKQSQAAVEAVEERMKNQEVELTNKLEYAGEEVATVRVEAERERQVVIDRHRAREERLEGEMQGLLKELGAERETMRNNKDSIKENLARKEELDAELAELQQRFDSQAQSWSSKYDAELEARRIEVAETQKKIEGMEGSAQLAAGEAEKRVADLQEQLAIKEKKKEESILAIQQEMSAQEKDLKNMVNQMSLEIANYKLEAQQDKMAVIEEYRAREQALHQEIEGLNGVLETEKGNIRVNQEMTGRVVAERVALDTELGELKRRYEQDSKDWSAQVQAEQEARRYEMSKAQLDLEEQQTQTFDEAAKLHDRVSNLKEQLLTKEKQKHIALVALKDEMKVQTTELKDKVNEMGVEVTNIKIESQREKMAVTDEYKAREEEIQLEMAALYKQLDAEKEQFNVNQELTDRILAQRVEVEAELETLKQQYEQERNQWSETHQFEQEFRRTEVAKVKEDLEQRQVQARVESEALQGRVSNLQSQLAAKERQKLSAVIAIKDEMKAQEKELKGKVSDIGMEVTNLKIEAQRENMAVVAKYEAREQKLKEDIAGFHDLIEAEKETLRVSQGLTNRILAQRIEIDGELGELKRRYEQEHNQWSAMHAAEQESRRVDASTAKLALEEQQQKALSEVKQIHDRVSSLQNQLATKERQKLAAVLTIKDEMKAQEKELKGKVSDIGMEVTNLKIEAQRENMAVVAKYEAREQKLKEDIAGFHDLIEAEKETLRVSQGLTNRILAQRIEIDGELGELKRRYEQEHNQWSAMHAAEQESRRVDASTAKLALEEQQQKALSEVKQIHDRVSSLQNQLATKERQKLAAVLTIKDEMKAQEKELKGKVSDIGMEVTNLKIEAQRERMAVVDQYEAREETLKQEMAEFRDSMEAEKEALRVSQGLTNRILAQRIEIDAELGELKRRYEQERNQWSTKYSDEQEARRVEVTTAKQALEEQQQKALSEVKQIHGRVSNLQNQLATKERQKLSAVLAIKDEMKAQEKELKGKVSDIGMEVTNLKIEAQREKMAVVAEYKSREQQLQHQIESFHQFLDAERDAMKVNKDMTHRILAQRIEIDAELGVLKRRYETDSKQWDAMYAAEQNARTMEVTRSQHKMQELQQHAELAVVEAEQRQAKLKEKLAAKERQKLSAVLAIKDEMKVQEKEMKEKVNEFGMEVTNFKIEAHREKMAVVDEYEARERQLRNEIESFLQIINAEKEAAMINKELTNRVLEERVEIDAELDELKRLYEQDSKKWDSKYTAEHNARKTDVTLAQQQMQQLQQNAELAVAEAEQRQAKLTEQLVIKEKQKQAAILAVKDEMKAQEKELKGKVHDISIEATNIKIDANREKMAVIAEYKAREQQLQDEMEGLVQLLAAEKDAMKVSHDTMQNIFAQRVQIDVELGKLKSRYEQESKQWDGKVAAEQEARRAEVAKAQQQMHNLQVSAEQAGVAAEKRRASLMSQLSVKEKEKQEAIQSTKEEMKALETEVQIMLGEMGKEFTNLQMASDHENTVVADEYKAREAQLQKEMDNLQELLDAEKDSSVINKEMMDRVLSTRADLDAELGEMKRRYEQDSADWGAKYAAEQAVRRSQVAKAQQQMEDLQQNSARVAEEAEHRQASLIEQLSVKETQKQAAVFTVKNEMKAQEKQLKGKVAELGNAVTNVKLEAHLEKMAVIDEYKAREEHLKSEMVDLNSLLDSERATIKVNQELTHRILAQRVDIDAELGKLQKEYAQNNIQWDAKYKTEQRYREQEVMNIRQELTEQENKAQDTAREAQQRLEDLLGQVATKEKEKRESVQAITDIMKDQERGFQDKANALGDQATDAKMDAQKERMTISSEYEVREQDLLSEMEDLRIQLEAEKESIRVSNGLTCRVVTQRVDLDAELGRLKRKHEEDKQSSEENIKNWEGKFQAEQNARRENVLQAQEEAKAASEKLAHLEKDAAEKEQLKANVKLFLQQGRIDDALKFLGE